ncbi:MAG: M20/M25/M40 family metallo-hydrolase [Alphaproteobacteria bacterium]|nr:M20/M25/M40 family metallo-hydrolase [Alphaproteobacteria bacterium]
MTAAPDVPHAEALALTRHWCRIRSVRGDAAGLAEQAGAIVDWLGGRLGAEIVNAAGEGGRPPVIHARIDVGARDSVVLYNMYDVMPADAGGWSVDPFEGGTVERDGVGPCFVARGAENNKGPLAGMLCVLERMIGDGRLRTNVEILVEGEEESGSGALRAYLLDPASRVRRGRAALFPSFCEYGGGPPRVYLGFSGIAKGEAAVTGGAWGGPAMPIHSSNAPWIANPARRLVEALSRFGEGPTGMLATIDLDDAARGIVAALAVHFDPAGELRFRGAQRFAVPGDAAALLARVLATASVNVSELSSEPAGGDAVIPYAARARFDLRCPPPLDPSSFVDLLRRRLAEDGLAGVALRIDDSYPGWRFDRAAPGVDALLAAYARTAGATPQIWPWAIGSAPAYAFARHVDAFLIGGAGRGGNAHGVDEFMSLEGYARFLQSIDLWLTAMGDPRMASREPTR